MNVTINELKTRQAEILDTLDGFKNRELTADEKAQYETLAREFDNNSRKMDLMQRSASNTPADFSITRALREARRDRKELNLRSALTAAGLAGKAVEVEMQNILEPLYADSVLGKIGVRWFKDLPMGDISIPVMGKGSASWVAETGNNSDGTPTFGNNVVLKPNRLTAYFDISEKMLMQDTLGVQDALYREAVRCLADKFEATVLGAAQGSDNQPAGIFYNQNLGDATTFKKVCEIEAGVEDANVTGNMVYLLSTKAKADLRSMAKSSKNTQLVLEGGEVDGTPAFVTSNIAQDGKAPYVYGNFANLACAAWGDIILKVDDSIVYAAGKVRIYVTGYFDAKVLRSGAFAYGDTRYAATAAE